MPSSQFSDRSYDASFSELFRHFSAGLLLYARHFVSVHQVGEDIVHDVFVSLWGKKEVIDYPRAQSYLFRATRNACLDYLKGLKTHTRIQNEILREGDLPDSLDADFYVHSELRARIEAAIANLPPQQKEAFVKNRFEKKTFAQIASEMDISPRTVDKHIELALRSLRRDLADYLHIILYLGLFSI